MQFSLIWFSKRWTCRLEGTSDREIIAGLISISNQVCWLPQLY